MGWKDFVPWETRLGPRTHRGGVHVEWYDIAGGPENILSLLFPFLLEDTNLIGNYSKARERTVLLPKPYGNQTAPKSQQFHSLFLTWAIDYSGREIEEVTLETSLEVLQFS